MKFTFIILCYTEKKYVEETLKSVKSSIPEKTDVQIITMLDAGDADSILDDIEHENILIIKENFRSIAKSRNEGVQYATNDFLIFMDAGTILSKDAMLYVIEKFKKEPECLIATKLHLDKKLPLSSWILHEFAIKPYQYISDTGAGYFFAANKYFFLYTKFNEKSVIEDQRLYVSARKKGVPVYYVPDGSVVKCTHRFESEVYEVIKHYTTTESVTFFMKQNIQIILPIILFSVFVLVFLVFVVVKNKPHNVALKIIKKYT